MDETNLEMELRSWFEGSCLVGIFALKGLFRDGHVRKAASSDVVWLVAGMTKHEFVPRCPASMKMEGNSSLVLVAGRNNGLGGLLSIPSAFLIDQATSNWSL